MATRKIDRTTDLLAHALSQLINAQATLTTAQATLTANQATFMSQMTDMNRRLIGIEDELKTIRGILGHHEQLLQVLLDRSGFKPAK